MKINSEKRKNKKRGTYWSAWIGIFVIVTVLIFLYCIASNIINHLENVSNIVQIIFGLSDFANTAIGALLGFGTSLLLEKYLVAVNKEKVIDNIVAEMTQMCLYISEIFDPRIRTKDNNGNDITELSDNLQKLLNDSLTNKTYDKQYESELNTLKYRVINHRFKIYLPIWDSVLQNGDLLRFKDKEYFECLINIYTRLNRFRAQIDAFDASFENKKFEYLAELYSDVQSLHNYIKLHKFHLIFLCGYLKGECVRQLKTDFISRFELNVD